MAAKGTQSNCVMPCGKMKTLCKVDARKQGDERKQQTEQKKMKKRKTFLFFDEKQADETQGGEGAPQDIPDAFQPKVHLIHLQSLVEIPFIFQQRIAHRNPFYLLAPFASQCRLF